MMFVSSEYWNNRYRNGHDSGWGSYGKLADFKAAVINKFIKENGVKSVIDFGCGDGNQLGLFEVSNYLGVDVSEEAIKMCSKMYEGDFTKKFVFVRHPNYLKGLESELILSLDVIFHLVEDEVYLAYMSSLFEAAQKFVIIYSSNFDKITATHERERKFTDHVEVAFPEWRLIDKIDNPWPITEYSDGSHSDFYIYRKTIDA